MPLATTTTHFTFQIATATSVLFIKRKGPSPPPAKEDTRVAGWPCKNPLFPNCLHLLLTTAMPVISSLLSPVLQLLAIVNHTWNHPQLALCLPYVDLILFVAISPATSSHRKWVVNHSWNHPQLALCFPYIDLLGAPLSGANHHHWALLLPVACSNSISKLLIAHCLFPNPTTVVGSLQDWGRAQERKSFSFCGFNKK